MQENRSFDHYFGTLSGVRGFNDPSPVWKQYGFTPARVQFTQPAEPVQFAALSDERAVPTMPIPAMLDIAALRAAIAGSQRGVVMYPQFKRLSMAAGCIGYTVWIDGRHVSYYGRRGEVHIEKFPD